VIVHGIFVSAWGELLDRNAEGANAKRGGSAAKAHPIEALQGFDRINPSVSYAPHVRIVPGRVGLNRRWPPGTGAGGPALSRLNGSTVMPVVVMMVMFFMVPLDADGLAVPLGLLEEGR
jgi:hypothetical protein